MDILERLELFNERCILENNIFSEYGEILNEMEEHTERFVPGYVIPTAITSLSLKICSLWLFSTFPLNGIWFYSIMI